MPEITDVEIKEARQEFLKETDELLNIICDTFHDDLKRLASKYSRFGDLYLNFRLTNDG